MNSKYKKYIEYIARDIKPPYIHNMVNQYNLNEDEVVMVLSKLYDRPVTIKGNYVYDDNEIYYEDISGTWVNYEYDNNRIYYEDSDGYWIIKEYDINGKVIYFEDSDGYIEDNR